MLRRCQRGSVGGCWRVQGVSHTTGGVWVHRIRVAAHARCNFSHTDAFAHSPNCSTSRRMAAKSVGVSSPGWSAPAAAAAEAAASLALPSSKILDTCRHDEVCGCEKQRPLWCSNDKDTGPPLKCGVPSGVHLSHHTS